MFPVESRLKIGTRSSESDKRNTSASASEPESLYCGSPFSVLRVIDGRDRCQPRPKTPLPAPELYVRVNTGCTPPLAGLTVIGTVVEPVPLLLLTINFSPIPWMAPPPFGNDKDGNF